MKLYIEEQNFDYDNNVEAIADLFAKVEEIIESSSKILDHMEVDQVEVFQDFYEYFKANIDTINEVKVITLTYKELVEEILSSTVEYLRGAKSQVVDLSNHFYKTPIGEDWNTLKDLLTGIGWMISAFSSIDEDARLSLVVSSYESWNEYATVVHSLAENLENFEEALESQDNIAVADLLQYEIVPTFEDMEDKLSALITVDGGHNVN